jgi:aminopeptidase N
MRTETPHAIYLKDYTPPAWLIDTVDLHVAIHDGHAEVRARLACRRNPVATDKNSGGDLVLNGEELALQEVGVGGTALAPSRYTLADDSLTIRGVDGAPLPDSFTLDTVVRIDPEHNTQLMGLYASQDGYFTQCEAQGFRRITWFIDRPDVMARFTTVIHADRARFPIAALQRQSRRQRREPDGRHWARWVDPFQPSPLTSLRWSRRKLDELRTAIS